MVKKYSNFYNLVLLASLSLLTGMLNACGCTLNLANGSPVTIAPGKEAFPSGVAYNTTGTTLGVTDYYDGTISLFPIASDCSLGSPTILTATAGTISLAFSPNGTYVAVANEINGQVLVFNTSTGTQVPGSPYSAGGVALSTSTVAYSPDGAFLAAGNINNGSIYLYSVNASTGELTQVQVATQTTASQISNLTFTHSTSGNIYLIAANRGAIGSSNHGSVLVYQLTSGTLTSIGSFPANINPYAVAISPDDAYVAAGNYTSVDVTIYSLDSATGELTQIAGSPFATHGNEITTIAYSSDGSCLAVNNQTANAVNVLPVDTTTGAITSSGTIYTEVITPFALAYSSTAPCLSVAALGGLYIFPGTTGSCSLGAAVLTQIGAGTGAQPADVAFSPNSNFVATSNLAAGTVSVFSVASNGALTQISGSPFSIGASSSPISLAYAPHGTLLAVTDVSNNTVAVFSVAANGALTQVSGSPFATGTTPEYLSFSPNGQLLAVTNFSDNTVSLFSVASNGTLTSVAGSPFATGMNPQGVSFSPNGLNLAVVNDGDNTVSVFSVSSDGALTPVAGSPFPTGANTLPTYVAYSPDGTCLTVSNSGPRPGQLSVFSVASNGSLTPVQTVTLDPDPTSRGPNILAYSPKGKCLAVANNGQGFAAGSVAVLSTSGCTLTEISQSPYLPGFAPTAVAYSPNGKFLASVQSVDGTIAIYTVGSCIVGPISPLAQAIIDKYC